MRAFLAVVAVAACSPQPRITADSAGARSEADDQTSGTPFGVAEAGQPRVRSCGISSQFTLDGRGVGALAVGRPVAAVARVCDIRRDTIELDEEAMPTRYLTVRTAYGEAGAVVDDTGQVWRVEIEDPGLRTADSLGVGTTLSALLRYPGVVGGEGEAGLFVKVASMCGLTFRLAYEVPDDRHHEDWTNDELRHLPLHTPVDRVLAVGCTP